MKTMTKIAFAAGYLVVGTYGCRQVIGWEEPTYWGDQGGSGGSAGSGGSGGAAGGGMAGMAGTAGMGGAGGGSGGMGGVGGSGGTGGPPPECVVPADCGPLLNATRTCTDGKCGFTCNTGFDDCTFVPGCETNVVDNRANCGMCGNTCAAYCTGTTCNNPVSIAGGYHHHCAVLTNGDVYCWGRNEKGELGDGTLASRSVPTKVKGLPGPAVQVDGGASASAMSYTPKTCAVLMNGELWCWGEGNSVPAKVNGLANVKQVWLGNTHICAVGTSGTLYCWGGNVYGQVGNGGTGFVPVPTSITGSFAGGCAGGRHTCAINNGKALYCWGDNSNGQLGIGSKTEKDLPTAVSTISEVTDVRCGENFTCANSASGFYCWGGNTAGQLGTGSLSEELLPKLLNLQNIFQFDVSYNFGGAATPSSLYMWGFNGSSQLGNGTTMTSSNPQAITLTDLQMLRLASVSSCAIRINGEVLCWGGNAYGQVGNGNNQQQAMPTLVIWP